MLIQKYNYTPINRDTVEGKRLYTLPDGSRVPSVTTILDRTKPQEKRDALENWRKRVGTAKAQEITTEAASRGTRMHKWLEDYVRNDREMGEPGTNPNSQQSHKMAQQIVEHGLKHVDEVWGIEVPLYVPGLYAGLLMLVAYIRVHLQLSTTNRLINLRKLNGLKTISYNYAPMLPLIMKSMELILNRG